MKKSILALLLAVLMVASLLPAAAMAEGEAVAEVNGEQFATLSGAIESADDGDTVYLLQNYTISLPQEIDNGITLNLGGNTLTITGVSGYGLLFTSGNSTITNGIVVDERSKDNNNIGFTTVQIRGAASLTTSNVSFYTYQPTYISGNQYYNYVLRADANEQGCGTLTLDYGTVIAEYPRTSTEGTTYGALGVTVYGAYSSGNDVPENYTGEALVVNSGVTIETTGFAISGNGTKHGTTITINGGTLISKESTGIYHPQTGTLNINGGYIIGGETGIEIRAGEFNMTGGSVVGEGSPSSVGPNGNGTTSIGAGIAIAQHTTKLPIALNITGGTVEGFSAIYENNPQNNPQENLDDIELKIDGGTYNAINGGTTVIYSEDFEDFVTGGEFNNAIAAKYLDESLQYQVNNNGTYTYYETFDEALAAAENGAEIEYVVEGFGAENFTLTIDPANGGTKTVLSLPKDSNYTLPTVSKSGYAFLGWSDGVNTYPAGTVITLTSNVTYTASWVRHPDTPYVPEPEEPEEPEVPEFPFYDVPTSAWYYTAVKYVYDNKLMDGVDTYVFAPNDTLTRAMVWTIIARMSGVDTTGGNSWYAKAQEWVITNGISDGENPTAAITREEFVTMLWRLAGEPIYTGDLSRVPDAGSISTWAQNAMLWSYATGLTEGDENGALTPLATATRAQAAAMIMRFCESVK